MSATGVALAFEKEIMAWAERDVRHVTVPADTPRLDLDDLLKRLREERPGGRPSTITLDSDANAAVLVSLGRTNTFYLDPYTGAVRNLGAKGVREFMQTMIEWHRFLGGNTERRDSVKQSLECVMPLSCFSPRADFTCGGRVNGPTPHCAQSGW